MHAFTDRPQLSKLQCNQDAMPLVDLSGFVKDLQCLALSWLKEK